jgi:hypothetical protein
MNFAASYKTKQNKRSGGIDAGLDRRNILIPQYNFGIGVVYRPGRHSFFPILKAICRKIFSH